MKNPTVKQSIEAYRASRHLYEGFSIKIRILLEDIIKNANIKYQIVESRAKEVDSFEDKIKRPGKHYINPLVEITDLCGCRIIVYYQDDVDRVSDIIKKEFIVREENLSRQPDLLDVDRFGYLSAHYIVHINKSRTNLVEWANFSEFFAEIQVRTVIQHAWSAVSHALQYKQELSVPSKLQRRLYRIAGLFELADEEFVTIRNIREHIKSQVRIDLKFGETSSPLSPTIISEFVNAWEGLEKLRDESIDAGFEYDHEKEYTMINIIYNLCGLCGIQDLTALTSALSISFKDYFEAVISKNNHESWETDDDFNIVMALIRIGYKNITEDYLVSNGFAETIASILLDTAGEMEVQ